MKKIILKLAIATSLIMFSAATAGAANNGRINFRTGKAAMATDTPYMASVKIYRTGVKDTPYLYINTSPSTVYNELEQMMESERGTFKISISFYAETGMLIRNENYFLRKGDEYSPGRQ